MVEDRRTFQPQQERLPVNGGDHLQGHERITPEHPGKRAAIQGVARQSQCGVELEAIRLQDSHVHVERSIRDREAPFIRSLQGHERRDMERFTESPLEHAPAM